MANNGIPMTQAEKVDALMKQAELAYTMHNDRRQWEWKITLGLWAVILTTIVKDIALPLWVWIVTGAIYGLVWLRGVWVANENNKLWYDKAMKAAWDLAKGDAADICSRPDRVLCCKSECCVKAYSWAARKVKPLEWWLGFLFAWAMLFQLAATVGLMVVAYQYNKPPTSDKFQTVECQKELGTSPGGPGSSCH